MSGRKSKQKASEKLAKDIEAFERTGGKVYVAVPGETGDKLLLKRGWAKRDWTTKDGKK